MNNRVWLALLRARIVRTPWLAVLFLLATTFVVNATVFNYTTNLDGTITITGYTGPGGACVVPSSIDYKTVTGIGDGAFSGDTGLISVMIPGSVTSIVYKAFFDCASLTSIKVDSGNPVYCSIDGVLFDKSQTTLIKYPVGKAGSYTIPDGVTSIGINAFGGQLFFDFSTALTGVTIPDSVISIGDWAFEVCVNLTSVTIPDSVISIGENAFTWCHSLSSVTIGNGVTSIGGSAFWNCTELTSVTIPGSVTSIGDEAFSFCTGLTGVYFKGNAPNTDSTAFFGDDVATVYYLPGTMGWGSTFGGRPSVRWIPLIAANGIRENVRLNSGDKVTVSVAMNVGNYAEIPADWWAFARAGSSWYYINNSGQWTLYDGTLANCHPMYQGPLFDLPETQIMNTSLPVGSYEFWFAVDFPMDGILNIGGYILFDSVNVTVQ